VNKYQISYLNVDWLTVLIYIDGLFLLCIVDVGGSCFFEWRGCRLTLSGKVKLQLLEYVMAECHLQLVSVDNTLKIVGVDMFW
jgi:hypothetical protein